MFFLLLSGHAAAQGFDAHGFNLVAQSGDLRDGLVVQRPGRFQQGDWFLGGGFEWADRPLVYIIPGEDGADPSVEPVLDDLFALNLSGGAWVLDRWRVDVAAPLYFTSIGRDGTPQGVGLGDLRIASMVELLRPAATGFGLGLVPTLDLPTGNADAFLGQPGVAGGGALALGYEGARFTVGAEAGMQFNPGLSLENLSNADTLNWGLRGGWLVSDRLSLLAEARLETPLTPSAFAFTGAPAELTLSGRGRLANGAHVWAGGAAGLDRGASAATYRLFLGGGFGRIQTDRPTVPEPVGPASLAVTATLDGAPVAGAKVVLSAGEDRREATLDAEPWSLEVPGKSTWTGEASFGPCLQGSATTTAAASGQVRLTIPLERREAAVTVEVVDALGNFIPGASLSWTGEPEGCVPTEKLDLPEGTGKQTVGIGFHKLAVEAPGFAPYTGSISLRDGDAKILRVQLEGSRIRVEQQKIVILEVVYFEYNSDVLRSESSALLNEVASTLKLHPELGRVEVAGHTDGDGAAAFNLDLSQRRADRVVAFLVAAGVDPARLSARGYGESRPIASNASVAGKQKNRRVEFTLLDRATGTER